VAAPWICDNTTSEPRGRSAGWGYFREHLSVDCAVYDNFGSRTCIQTGLYERRGVRPRRKPKSGLSRSFVWQAHACIFASPKPLKDHRCRSKMAHSSHLSPCPHRSGLRSSTLSAWNTASMLFQARGGTQMRTFPLIISTRRSSGELPLKSIAILFLLLACSVSSLSLSQFIPYLSFIASFKDLLSFLVSTM
jgi:hypothetical protein